MHKHSLLNLAAVCLIACPTLAKAGLCDAYYSFDGTLSDASGNGYDGEMIIKGGELSTPKFTDGKFGQALMLDGNAAMRALLDLHYDACPQVTISAWVKVARDAPADSLHVFSTGGGSGPGLTISGTGLNLKGTENGIYRKQVIRKGSWIFVAGVYDYAKGDYTLYSGRPFPPAKLSEVRYEPQNAIWVGTVHDDWGVFARGVAVDELRITGRALQPEEVTALRSRQAERTVHKSDVDGFTPKPTQLPGDHFEPTQLPGDHFEPAQLPADQQVASHMMARSGAHGDGSADTAGLIDYETRPDQGSSGLPGGGFIDHVENETDIDYEPPPETLPESDTNSADEEEYTGGHHPGDTPVTSALSGFSGNVVDTIDLRDEFNNQIVFAYRGLQPCRITVRKTGRLGKTRTLEYCEHTDAHHVEVSGLIRSLRVCSGQYSRQIRGMQVWEAEIRASGRVDTSSTDTTHIESCNRWHQEVSCPAGHLATGLEVHATTSDSDFEHIVGLKLLCREVVRDFP